MHTVTRLPTLGLLLLLTTALVGCTTGTEAPPVASPSVASPVPTAEPRQGPLPSVPVRSADLTELPTGDERPVPAEVLLTSLGLQVPVDPVGVQADGQMEIPPLAERAGWYRFGAAPGEAGTAVVAAHVDSVASAGAGPFARLGDLVAGDRLEVRLTDGAVLGYTVTSVEQVPKTEAAWPDVFTREGAHRLVLVTCGGTFARDARSYSDNVIVTADPDGG